ncbi:2-hydroxyacid dehydrogenase [Arthrobacter crystallopoietes]|uniref:2-hydroxyacid dehydrogenase n=1 Tax=Crystallibacter crystallopoietes TaxID=37928 RepID=UPI0011115086|nr:2-hydroxyacid dehydrogenase [Arthrobacter crystallopoietes]QTG81239.1 2-hydroxyacid dehydrogenase [Arthrobacter crystallopoietes]
MTTTQAVLQVGPLMPAVQDPITTEYGAVRLPDDADERAAFLAARGAEFGVAVTSGRFGVGTELMNQLPHLRAVINFGVGYDTTDVAQAAERGIAVSNTPDVLNDCVADTALALYLDVLRRISTADRYVRRGDWLSKGNFPLATKASGKRVGIVGLGRIGKVIARRLEGFDCLISYHNRRPVDGVSYEYQDSLIDLARDSDVLIVAAAGGPDSAGLISAEVIEALGRDGYLINIARGSVVDESALAAALVKGKLAGAGLDVFADEPKVPVELLGLDNVVVLPHLGSGTHETRADMAQLALANLKRFMDDGTLETPVL